MCSKIKIIEISDDLKSKSNHDFDFKIIILILKSKSCPSLGIVCRGIRKDKVQDLYWDNPGHV